MTDSCCCQPDVMAIEEETACEILQRAGFTDVRTVLSSPPWPGEGIGPRRVIRQTITPDGMVELIVAHVRHAGRKRDSR